MWQDVNWSNLMDETLVLLRQACIIDFFRLLSYDIDKGAWLLMVLAKSILIRSFFGVRSLGESGCLEYLTGLTRCVDVKSRRVMCKSRDAGGGNGPRNQSRVLDS